MRLKQYQIASLDTLSGYLRLLGECTAKVEAARAAIAQLPPELRSSFPVPQAPTVAAWDEARKSGIVASCEPWRELTDGLGQSIAHVCLKIPTGGGKTLLAAHGLDRIMVSHFRRNTGLVLWIVPSEAIYNQTKKQLSDRTHPVRQALDRAGAGRVKIIEKLDGFSRQDVEQKLCVLLLMLQSTGRENKESLKVFRDSGQYISFFPQDDSTARAALLKVIPNLETVDPSASIPTAEAAWIKQSLGNTLRLIGPVIVLDEGHRAYSSLARETLANLNPRFMLELSATPDAGLSNILVNVTGRELKDEEMIKLPIRLEVGRNLSWQTLLQHSLDRLNDLHKRARQFQNESGRYIRPIMLVRVDRTGKEQRGKGGVHSEDVFEYLTQKAGVPPDAVRRQTAEVKELRDDDLLSPYCGVRVIITKDALREGWDCPFAYVLAILSKGTAGTALTQMIGRVLRQPQAALTGIADLDQTHVFCADLAVGDAVQKIKTGLESEGLGDIAAEIQIHSGQREFEEVNVQFRKEFRRSRVMVPRVLHRTGRKAYRELDFEADVLAEIDFDKLSFRGAGEFQLADYDRGVESTILVDLATQSKFGLDASLSQSANIDQPLNFPDLVRRMLDVVPNPWQAARILEETIAVLRTRAPVDKIIASRLTLVDAVKRDLQEQIDAAAEQIFRSKVNSGHIIFKLLATPLDDLNVEFAEQYTTHIALSDARAPLLHSGGKPLDRALYDRVFRRDFNAFEEQVALYIDGRDAVEWWWRIASRGKWGLQGWMKNRVYPDFLVRIDADGHSARLMVLETKGKHLEGSGDTEFKSRLFKVLEDAYASGKIAGDVELFPDAPNAMHFRILLQEQAWKNDLETALTGKPA
ncbi:MAG TPA: DEAD/DEAH box helicase family protein [Micropepsaceae bacterium]|nr:DEAD/DEAH box helicase family protein [Micropepsaceae bacterium]